MKRLSAFLALILGVVPMPAGADQVVNLPFNYLFNGDVLINSLTVGQCLQAGTGGKLQSSGAACGGGGGGVTSVTGSGNIASSGGTTPNITFTGTLGVSSGGTGAATLGTNDVLLGNGTAALQAVAPGTSGNVLTSNGTTWTSSAPAGGGVTSVTSTTPLALTASPTTGTVSIAIPTSPTFGGNVTVGQLSSSGSVTGSILGGANLNVAGCAAINNANQIVGTGISCATQGPILMPLNAAPQFSGIPLLPSPLANQTYGGSGQNETGAAPIGMSIGHLNVTCAAYNSADATAGRSVYNPLNSNGLGGATIGFAVVNGSNTMVSPIVIGSVVMPTSPTAGPYVVSVTSVASSPYTVLAGDSIVLDITATSGTAAQWDQDCQPFVGP